MLQCLSSLFIVIKGKTSIGPQILSEQFFFFLLLKYVQDPPERPRVYERDGVMMTAELEEEKEEHVQLWRMSGETCPEGTIPIRRTTEQDVLRASSVRRFGRKPRRRVRRDSTSNGHEVGVFKITLQQKLPCLRKYQILSKQCSHFFLKK